MNNKIKSLMMVSALIGSQSLQVFANEDITCEWCGDKNNHIDDYIDARCNICDIEFSCPEEFNQHAETHGIKKYSCEICGIEILEELLEFHKLQHQLMGESPSEPEPPFEEPFEEPKEEVFEEPQEPIEKPFEEPKQEEPKEPEIEAPAPEEPKQEETVKPSIPEEPKQEEPKEEVFEEPIGEECICGSRHDNQEFICEECDNVAFGCEKALDNHIEIKHTQYQGTGAETAPEDIKDLEEENCPHCGKPNHTVLEYTCPCGDDFGCQETLDIHMDETGHKPKEETKQEEPKKTYKPTTTYSVDNYTPSKPSRTYTPSTPTYKPYIPNKYTPSTGKGDSTELVKTGDAGMIAYGITGLGALGGIILSIFKKRK